MVNKSRANARMNVNSILTAGILFEYTFEYDGKGPELEYFILSVRRDK